MAILQITDLLAYAFSSSPFCPNECLYFLSLSLQYHWALRQHACTFRSHLPLHTSIYMHVTTIITEVHFLQLPWVLFTTNSAQNVWNSELFLCGFALLNTFYAKWTEVIKQWAFAGILYHQYAPSQSNHISLSLLDVNFIANICEKGN